MNRLLWSLTPRRTARGALALVVVAATLVAGQASGRRRVNERRAQDH
jgi:hypothetical protein